MITGGFCADRFRCSLSGSVVSSHLPPLHSPGLCSFQLANFNIFITLVASVVILTALQDWDNDKLAVSVFDKWLCPVFSLTGTNKQIGEGR